LIHASLIGNKSSDTLLNANFEWLIRYFKEIQDVKRTILAKSDMKNPVSFKDWVKASTDYLVNFQNENPLVVLCHIAGCSDTATANISDKPEDLILLEFSREDTHNKYLSQGLLRMFGPDFVKRPDVSEWLNQEILADFNQFVANKK